MQWHQERQRVLAENISNSSTPNFRPRDLVEPQFNQQGASVGGTASLAMARTSASHMGSSEAGPSFKHDGGRSGFLTRPAGNAVNLVGGADAKAMVQDNELSNNGGGVLVDGAGANPSSAVIDGTTIDTHKNFAVKVVGPGSAFLSASSLIGSGPKLDISGGGTVTSYGNNVIRGSGALPTTTLPLQ